MRIKSKGELALEEYIKKNGKKVSKKTVKTKSPVIKSSHQRLTKKVKP